MKIFAIAFAGLALAGAGEVQEVELPAGVGFKESPHAEMGNVSPSGKWVFGVKYGPRLDTASLDTVVLWRFGTQELIRAYIGKQGETPNFTSHWVGDEKIYFGYVDNHVTKAFTLDVSDITKAPQAVPKAAPRSSFAIHAVSKEFLFNLDSPAPAVLVVKTLGGKLVNEIAASGGGQITWGCEDRNGNTVPAGTYAYVLKQHGREYPGMLKVVR